MQITMNYKMLILSIKQTRLKKQNKLTGRAAFSDSVISCLRGFNNWYGVENLADQNPNIIAFNIGYKYDIKTDDYRRINKQNLMTKTMRIRI